MTACTQLAAVHKELNDALDQTIAEDNEALKRDQTHHALMAPSLSSFVLETGDKNVDGQAIRRRKVGDLVEEYRLQLQRDETELGVLWDDWEAAQNEVQGILEELMTNQGLRSDVSGSADQSFVSEDRSEPLDAASIREEFHSEMKQLQGELNALAKVSYDDMKTVEKVGYNLETRVKRIEG